MARRKKTTEEQTENLNNTANESDDTFGLPEIEYEPLKRDEPKAEEPKVAEPVEEAVELPAYEEELEAEEVVEEKFVPNYMREEQPSMMPKVLGIALVLLLLAGGGWWYFAMYQPKIKAAEEKAKQEEAARLLVAQKAEQLRLAEQARLDAERRAADSLAAAIPAEGLIETLSGRTGRYYIVIASDVDDDLIMDYARKLSVKGVSCKIIPPFGKTIFSRLAIDVADTYADAQANADSKKGGDFGNEVWVVKY